MRFTTILASRIINNAILPLDSEDRANVLIIDGSMFERNRSKKVELLAKVYDHAKHIVQCVLFYMLCHQFIAHFHSKIFIFKWSKTWSKFELPTSIFPCISLFFLSFIALSRHLT